MKLIIDIPKEAYNVLLTEQVLPPHIDVEWLLIHGIPLDDVKAEIEELKSCCDDDWDAFLVGRKDAYNNVLQIIDKHISGKENE